LTGQAKQGVSVQVKLDDARLQQADTESKLRQLQSGSNMSDLFQRYETVIAQLQSDRNALQEQNDALAQQVVRLQVGQQHREEGVLSPPPRQPGAQCRHLI
jgi:cell division protein YceG involved in septum cleavage